MVEISVLLQHRAHPDLLNQPFMWNVSDILTMKSKIHVVARDDLFVSHDGGKNEQILKLIVKLHRLVSLAIILGQSVLSDNPFLRH